ncbi:MAG: NUDIX hydrolase [Planctomycetales bacterium]|nr:NUDIX hydrolase [Planctomycetales bacterium]
MESHKRELEIQTLLTASRFRVERVTQRFADGSSFTREVVRHPGAVVIVPVLDDGRICLIRNYRVAVDRELLELPAGTLEPGEPPLETARRELIEETGFRAAEVVPLYEFYMSPGILDERMYAYLATGLTAGPPARELGEQIENQLVTLAELDALLRDGSVQDSKSLSALLYYLRYCEQH